MKDERWVVKIGGSGGIRMLRICQEVASLVQGGTEVVVVHGGSQRATQLGEALGHPPVFLRSPSGHVSRYTDRRTRDIFVQAVQQVNDELVGELASHGIQTWGMTGDRCALQGERKKAWRAVQNGRQRVIRDDYSGRVVGVDRASLEAALASGAVPVIPPLALSENHGLLNIDGDRAAAAVAQALGADRLMLFTDVVGLLREYPREDTLVSRLTAGELDQAQSWAEGRMKRKILSVREAIRGGVEEVVLADGRREQPVQAALAGRGTRFVREGDG